MRPLKISKGITDRQTISVRNYLRDLQQLPLLSVEEESALMEGLLAGDPGARATLVRGNLRFVVSVAKQYEGRGVALADLVSEGNIGLCRAAETFDPSRGFKFISFAVWWIRQAIMMAIVEQSRTVRLPSNRNRLKELIARANSELEQALERPGTAEELATHLAIPLEEIEWTLRVPDYTVSLDAPGQDTDQDETLHERLADPDQLPVSTALEHRESLQTDLARYLGGLPLREREVLERYFGLGGYAATSLELIGEHLNLTKERVRQLREKALQRLSKSKGAEGLRKYLG